MIPYFLGLATGALLVKLLRPYYLSWQANQLQGLPQDIDPDLYEEAETIPNATVQVMRNTRTGEYSIGWWRNK